MLGWYMKDMAYKINLRNLLGEVAFFPENIGNNPVPDKNEDKKTDRKKRDKHHICHGL
jgi:hypothetical protein